MSKIPVLVLAFNRADHVAEAMKAIREYQPERLYLECDGARPHKAGEKEAVEETRKAMLDAVDWPCEVKTLFRDENLGCANAVYGAISWFFEHEEYGIICEDDIILSPDFFKLCEELLPRYKDEERVMHINSEYHKIGVTSSDEYTFAKFMYCWGWASWRRAWAKMDMTMSGWPSYSKSRLRKEYGHIKGFMYGRYYDRAYYIISNNLPFSSWAVRWGFSIINNNGFCINPKVQLSKNIGMDTGTHYNQGDKNPYKLLKTGKLKFPLKHPDSISLDNNQVNVESQDFLHVRIVGLKNRIKKTLR